MVHADAPRGAEEVQEAEIGSPIRIGDLLAIQKGRPAFGFGCKRGISEAAGARKRGFEKIRPKEPRASHAHHPAGLHVVERAEKNPLASQQILKQSWKQLPGAR